MKVTCDGATIGVNDCEVVQEDVEQSETLSTRNKYSREIVPGVWIDCYDVLRAFEVNDPCLSHLAKKALCAGLRGHKDRLEDLEDIKKSVERAIEMHKVWNSEQVAKS